jgi:hypothetical protein
MLMGQTMDHEKFKEHVQKRIRLTDKISILESVDQLSMEKITDGVLLIWVVWSVGWVNCVKAIEWLQAEAYGGDIFIINTDTLTRDQVKIFEPILGGWGEIFVIRDGRIVEGFGGRNSSQGFRAYLDKGAGDR